MLYIKLIIKLDKRRTEANLDCPEHNETDINRPVCVQVDILIAFQKLPAKMVCRGSKHDAVFLLSVYTRLNINYVYKRLRRMPLFSYESFYSS